MPGDRFEMAVLGCRSLVLVSGVSTVGPSGARVPLTFSLLDVIIN